MTNSTARWKFSSWGALSRNCRFARMDSSILDFRASMEVFIGYSIIPFPSARTQSLFQLLLERLKPWRLFAHFHQQCLAQEVRDRVVQAGNAIPAGILAQHLLDKVGIAALDVELFPILVTRA